MDYFQNCIILNKIIVSGDFDNEKEQNKSTIVTAAVIAIILFIDVHVALLIHALFLHIVIIL